MAQNIGVFIPILGIMLGMIAVVGGYVIIDVPSIDASNGSASLA